MDDLGIPTFEEAPSGAIYTNRSKKNEVGGLYHLVMVNPHTHFHFPTSQERSLRRWKHCRLIVRFVTHERIAPIAGMGMTMPTLLFLLAMALALAVVISLALVMVMSTREYTCHTFTLTNIIVKCTTHVRNSISPHTWHDLVRIRTIHMRYN